MAPPFNADQWVAEALDEDVPTGGDIFAGGVPITPGQPVFPAGHQGLVTSIRCSAFITAPAWFDARGLVWSLLRNNSPVPGYQNRRMHGQIIHVPLSTIDVPAVGLSVPAVQIGGGIDGELQGKDSASCALGCDYTLFDPNSGQAQINVTLFQAPHTITQAAHSLDVAARQEQVGHFGMPDGVLVPVWLNENDVLRFLVASDIGVVNASVNVSIGGALWPIPSDDSAGI